MDLSPQDDRHYSVVVNSEEQYSIWGTEVPLPTGWSAVGMTGAESACLDWIESAWTDMRPLSLRQRMQEAPPPSTPASEPAPSLVERLCRGDHALELCLSERNLQALRACLERQFIEVRFESTRGGTILGLSINSAASDLTALEAGRGGCRLVGSLILDSTPVQVVADIDLETLRGMGRLVLEDCTRA